MPFLVNLKLRKPPMKTFLERTLATCITLLALEGVCFSIGYMFLGDEARKIITSYGIWIGLSTFIAILVFSLFYILRNRDTWDP